MTRLLPREVVDDLLARWAEPHRRYHATSHLDNGLEALELLGGGPLERIAFWFHDAVHTNTTPDDETASAGLAADLLAGHLPDVQVAEVQRLIMLTTHHQPEAGDLAGARVCDADLSGMGAPWEDYRANIRGIRAELGQFDDAQWRHGRARFLEAFLERDRIFHTPLGSGLWEERARANMERELSSLRPAGPAG